MKHGQEENHVNTTLTLNLKSLTVLILPALTVLIVPESSVFHLCFIRGFQNMFAQLYERAVDWTSVRSHAVDELHRYSNKK
jgi:hypothetical protein